MRIRFVVLLGAIASALSMSSVQAADVSAGKAIYDHHCVTCHLPTGQGLPGTFPSLAQSDFFKKAKPENLVQIVRDGLTGDVVVNGVRYSSVMPPSDLTDQETADVLNFVSVQFNSGKPILTAASVKAIRAAPRSK